MTDLVALKKIRRELWLRGLFKWFYKPTGINTLILKYSIGIFQFERIKMFLGELKLNNTCSIDGCIIKDDNRKILLADVNTLIMRMKSQHVKMLVNGCKLCGANTGRC